MILSANVSTDWSRLEQNFVGPVVKTKSNSLQSAAVMCVPTFKQSGQNGGPVHQHELCEFNTQKFSGLLLASVLVGLVLNKRRHHSM